MGSKREHPPAARPTPGHDEPARVARPSAPSPRRHLRKPAQRATPPAPGERPDPTRH